MAINPLGMNQGTQNFIRFEDDGGTINTQIVDVRQGSIAVTAGTVVNNGGTVAEVTNGTIRITAGTITSVTDLANLAKGTITRVEGGTIGLVTTVTNLSNGTIQNSGTTTGVGTISNIAVIHNAGTIAALPNIPGGTIGVVSSVTNLAAGTVTRLEQGSINVTAGTVVSNGGTLGLINPKSSKTTVTYGTTTTGTIGTLVAAPGAGTSIWVQSLDISSHNGTVDTVVSFGLVASGTSCVNRGNYGAQGGISKAYPSPLNGQVTNTPLTWNVLGGSGTVSYNVAYYVE